MKTAFLYLLSFIIIPVCKSQVTPAKHIVYSYHGPVAISDTTAYSIPNVLKKINESVSAIHSGEYQLHDKYVMLNIGEDTTNRKEEITNYAFKRNTDSLIGYHIAFTTSNGESIYDGTTLYENNYKTLTITDAGKFPAHIKRFKSPTPNMPFMHEANDMIQNYAKFNRPIYFIGIENVENEKYYKLQLGNVTDASYVQYYISMESWLPVRSSVILTHIDHNAKRVQTFNDWITDVKINTEISDSRFSKSALRTYNKEIQFTDLPDGNTKLLPVGSTAPDWELPMVLNNKPLKLSSLAGKIVIMDFWYKACEPCQQQMIELEKLYAAYNKSNVAFVGINTIDEPVKNKLKLFLNNRKITMPSVYNGKKIEPLYHSYSSPILYIIGKDGKIIYTQDGFSETLFSDVKKIIDQNL